MENDNNRTWFGETNEEKTSRWKEYSMTQEKKEAFSLTIIIRLWNNDGNSAVQCRICG